MKTWSRVTNEAGRSNKGRIPSWFMQNFIKGLEYKDNEILHIYTDAGKKDNNCGVGWVILDEKGVEIYTDNMGFMRSGIKNKDPFKSEVKISDEVTWEYMTYWRGLLINQNPREFMKEVNQIKYKAEWLVLDINRCSYIRDGYRLGIVDGNYYLRYHGIILLE
ncbi:unnamed protein product [Rhizophagus irregularis]|nr:unnamed protein product [Rhizophagus irregularis]